MPYYIYFTTKKHRNIFFRRPLKLIITSTSLGLLTLNVGIIMKLWVLPLFTILLMSATNCNRAVTKADGVIPPVQAGSLLIAPKINSEQSTMVIFYWRDMGNVDHYQLKLSTNKGFTPILMDSTVDSSRVVINSLPNDTIIYWKVRTYTRYGKPQWSEVWHFRTSAEPDSSSAGKLAPPEQMAPSAKEKNVALKPHFKWKVVNGADVYQLDVSQGDQMIIHQQVDGTGFTPDKSLSPDEKYYWRVRAITGETKGKWSEIHSFTTAGIHAVHSPGSGNDIKTDRKALMDLYKATNGKHWTNNSGWGSNAPIGTWYGIKANAQGRVSSIDLYKNNLRGHLPKSIGDLDKVTYLNVKNNYLTGRIPSTIGNMSSMEWLIMAGRTYPIGGYTKEPPKDLDIAYHEGKHLSNTNDFSGKIPSTIGKLSNLDRLEIANQPNIKGPIPSEIGNLSKLEGLYLSWDDFSGTKIPISICQLHNLKQLYLAKAKLTGNIPKCFENLTELIFLNLAQKSATHHDQNYLTGKIPVFSKLINLHVIDLNNNKLTGTFPKYFNNGNFTHLHVLGLGWNDLTGTLPDFTNMQGLYSLMLNGNEFSGSVDALTNLPAKIKIINVGWNNFTDELPQSGWPDFYQIKTIYLNNNNLTGKISCDFWNAISNPNLGWVYLSNEKLTGNCIEALNNLEHRVKWHFSISGNIF